MRHKTSWTLACVDMSACGLGVAINAHCGAPLKPCGKQDREELDSAVQRLEKLLVRLCRKTLRLNPHLAVQG